MDKLLNIIYIFHFFKKNKTVIIISIVILVPKRINIHKKLPENLETVAELCNGENSMEDIRKNLNTNILNAYLLIKKLHNNGIIELRRKIQF